MASLACTIDSAGITAPDYAEILDSLLGTYREIYGEDIYLGTDSQDFQLLAVFARAINDCNSVSIAVYNAFSPATAQGENLSSVVKINGMTRAVPSSSTMALTVGGSVGISLPATSFVLDQNEVRWYFDNSIIFDATGRAYVTATCETPGAVSASPNSVRIGSPSYGWQTVTNDAATPGAAVELDPALRARQAQSTALPSNTVLEGIIGAVLAVPGVVRVGAYENATGSTDANGIPANTLALVVDGGDTTAIATQIAARKTPGGRLVGNTSAEVVDAYGNRTTIKFYRVTIVEVSVTVTIEALQGYTSAIGTAISQSVAKYISSLSIGQEDYLTRLYAAAASVGQNFNVTQIVQGRSGQTQQATNIVPAFNEAVHCLPTAVTVVVT